MMHAKPIALLSAHNRLVFCALLVGCTSTAPVESAGEMYRWVDEQGSIHLTDTPPQSKSGRQELKVYKSTEASPQTEDSNTPAAETGSAKLTPTKPGGVVVVDAVLNRRLTVPLMLDTGADFTVLTKQAAQELRLRRHRRPSARRPARYVVSTPFQDDHRSPARAGEIRTLEPPPDNHPSPSTIGNSVLSSSQLLLWRR
jgi:hypothetical protein